MEKHEPQNIDEYIMLYPVEVQAIMQRIREVIKEASPQVTEKISWGMPTFYYLGNVIHFAGNKSHLGIYPGASGVEHFLPELIEFKTSKGAIQFSYNKPLPVELIQRIVKFRVAENEQWAVEKKKR